MSIARILSELVLDTPDDEIPQPSYDAATKMLLDTCACAFAGRQAPAISEIVDLECELSAAGCGSVFFHRQQIALPATVFCNAAIIHAMDFDNNYPGADLHILSIVVPVAIACGEERRCSGKSCLSSIILGVEAASRIAKPYMRSKRPHAYFLTTSLVGGWGGVAAAARIMGLSVDQTVHAMGIYYAHTCGNRQALLERALTKRIQPAIAARAAVYSALLARRGVTGPEHVFEGAAGFYRCYTQSPPPSEASLLAPSVRAIQELVVKQFPTCGIHHASILSALHLRRTFRFAPDDIEFVEFFLRPGGNTLVSMPFEPGPNPQVDAQFCAPYAIALALHKGSVSVRDFVPERLLQDQTTTKLAQRTKEVTCFDDLKLRNYLQPEPGCQYLKVALRNGTVLEHECRGDVLNDPALFGVEDVREKFRECISMYGEVDAAFTEKAIGAVLSIQHERDVRGFVAAVLHTPPDVKNGCSASA